MKKLKSSIWWLTLFLVISLLSACANHGDNSKNTEAGQVKKENGKIVIYTTLYPLYDFASKIAGDQAVVENIVPPGVESHEFEPTVRDMMKLNEADLFLYNGAGFEGWVEKAVQALNNKNLLVIETSKNIQLLENNHLGEQDHAEHGDFDPHIWLDPNRAKQQASMIKEALVQIDPSHESLYEDNFKKLTQQFDDLDTSLKDLSAHTAQKELVVSHAAFGYLTTTYGFQQLAISGMTPSDEPTQQELQQIIEAAKAYQVKYIMFEAMVSGKVADVVKNELGAQALTLNTLENLTEEQINQGKDYFSVMKENIETLKTALEYKK